MNKDFLELFFSFEHLWKFSSDCLKFWKPQAVSEYAHLTNSFASRCFSNYLWWRISSFLFFFFSFLKKFLLVAQFCLTFCDPKDCRWPSSSVHGILQARMLEWVASPFSRRSSWSRDEILVSHIAGGFFNSWGTREPKKDFSLSCFKYLQAMKTIPLHSDVTFNFFGAK